LNNTFESKFVEVDNDQSFGVNILNNQTLPQDAVLQVMTNNGVSYAILLRPPLAIFDGWSESQIGTARKNAEKSSTSTDDNGLKNVIQVAGDGQQQQSATEVAESEPDTPGKSRRRRKANGGICRLVRPAAAMLATTTLASVLQPASSIIKMQDTSILHYDPWYHATYCSLYEDYDMSNLTWSVFRVFPEVD